jgi:uncharacterized protein involved in outer membrane biogenesis
MIRKNRLFVIVAAVLLLLIVVIVVVLKSLDLDQYKPLISEQVKRATGRDLVIDGHLELDIGLDIRIGADNIGLRNASWGSRPDMVVIKRVEAEMALLPLLFGDLEIGRVKVIEPDILLETDKQGNGNWNFVGAAPAPETGAKGFVFPDVSRVEIERASIAYRDGKSGEEHRLSLKEFQAQADSLEDPLQLSLKGSYDKESISASGEVDSIRRLVDSQPATLDLQADVGALRVALQGKATVRRTGYAIRDLVLAINDQRLKGGMEYDLGGERPALKGDLGFDVFDLRKLVSTGATKRQQPAKNAKVFPTQDIDLEGLRAMDADISLRGQQILGPDLSLKNLDAQIGLNRGVLKLAPVSMAIGGGTLKGDITLDGRGSTPKLAINLSGYKVGLGNMLAETGAADLVTGAVARTDVDLKGQGRSVAALMGSLSGRALVDIGKGRFNNKHLNLAGADLVSELVTALNPFARKERFTQLECAVINLPFHLGVAEYDKGIAIETDKMTVISSGQIDMRKETLDIGMVPKPRKDSVDLGVGAGDVVSAARLQGTFADPKLGIDAANTAKAGLKVYGAIASGGTSLLIGGLLEKLTADPHPCQTALGKQSAGKTGQKKSGIESLFGL